MKKGKVFGKGQIALVMMVLALGAAVWLNMRFSSAKYLGEAKYVGTEDSSSGAVETGAKVSGGDSDYFTTAAKEREDARKSAQELIEETLKSEKLTDDERAQAVKKTGELADRIERETNIQSLLKAKGFEKTLAVIDDNGVNIIVKSDGLTTAQTLQIQDVVTGQTGIDLAKIKIIPVK